MVTLIIIAVTCLVSILCFTGALNGNRLLFNAYSVWHRREWYRMLSHGLVHGGWGHLLFNMLTLYFFGGVVEQYFALAFGSTLGILLYVALYVTAIAVSSIWDLVKYRDDWSYNAVGASGAQHGQYRPYRPLLGRGLRTPFPAGLPSGLLPALSGTTRTMTRFLHIVGRTSSLVLILVLLFSCGAPRHLSRESLVDAIWTFSQSHPKGFTLDVRKMTEPREGISVAYWATQDSHGRQALEAVVSHATTHDGFVGGWLDPSDSLFGKANFQKAIYKLSTGEEIILKEDIEFVSPTNLLIMYDPQVGKGPLLRAVKSYGAEIIYEYHIISGIAIKVPGDILQAIAFFANVKGVTAVERDHIYHLIEPVKPHLEVR